MALALRAIGQRQASVEHQLVAAVRQGDDRAFEELFARYRSRITGYVLGMVRDHARAEDITQEVFLSALRRLRDTERPIAFKPWIYEIAKNACIDEFRRTRRTSEVSLNGDDDAPSGDGNLVSKQPTPDMAMENKQRLEALRGAFRGLSENHHRILVMRELEGLSYAEIAHRMGMSKPMVESSLFRARRRLSEEYEELTSGRRCQQVCEVVDRADASTIRVLGVRARRQVALHLSHCDDCRRYARAADADESLFRAPTFADKVAALLPFGWLGRLVGRHAPVVSDYVSSLGSSGVLGRVAAAVVVLAAAGGSYAGVSLSTPTPQHNSAAVISRSTIGAASSATAHGAGGGGGGRPPTAIGAAGNSHPAPGGHPGGGAGGTNAPAQGGSGAGGSGAGGPGAGGTHPGPSTSSSGGTGGSSSGSAGSGGTPHSGPGIGNITSPSVPHVPSVGAPNTGSPPAVHVPSVPNLPSVPNIPKPSLPHPPAVNAPSVGQITGHAPDLGSLGH